jgi:DNA-binding GntR family transcriptional regulator
VWGVPETVALISGTIVAEMMTNALDQQIKALQEIVERMEQDFGNGNIGAFSEDDLAFHLKLKDPKEEECPS